MFIKSPRSFPKKTDRRPIFLTEPQQALVTQWLPLATKIAHYNANRQNVGPDEEEAIHHDAMVALVRAAANYDPDRADVPKAAFPTYLSISVQARIRRGIHHRIKKRQVTSLQICCDLDALCSKDHHINQIDARDLLQKAMRHLTDHEKKIVRLRHIDGHTPTQIASSFGVSKTAIYFTLRDSMRKMRAIIAKEGADVLHSLH